jgi:hypothetical protein
MKHVAIVALMMLNLGIGSLYAQHLPLKMTFSGSMVATALDLQPNSVTDEEHIAGFGTLGPFTFHKLRTDGTVPRSSVTCSGANQLNLPVVGGAGVFRFLDGSLLTVTITGGDLCVDFTAFLAHLTETYEITGGTGLFKNAAAICHAAGADCNLKLKATLSPVLADASGSVKFLTTTGEFEGNISRHAMGQ